MPIACVLEPRLYQRNIAETCIHYSTLVVLPTGLGKTLIAMMVMKKKVNEGKILFLAPTKPLVEQHFKTVSSFFEGTRIEMLTGSRPKKERVGLYADADIAVATPQVIGNDIDAIDLSRVALIVFDEAHRAVGNYSYVGIAQRYLEEGIRPHTMGMTASPGSDAEKILEICRNLGIEKIEIRSEDDEDVKPYVSAMAYEWITVELPEEMKRIRELLEGVYEDAIKELKSMGYLRAFKKVPKRELIALGKEMMDSTSGARFRASTYYAIALKVEHAIGLIETQDVSAFLQYFERMKSDTTRAKKVIFSDPRVIKAIEIAGSCSKGHEKVEKVLEVVTRQVKERKDSKIIVFAQYRDVVEELVANLNSVYGIRTSKFIGQANRSGEKGLKQREQMEIMEKFRSGEYNVIVATSVGEEGLDIPNTDMVVFYEPSPSEIRTIQRRGRTGRNMPGRVVFLITRGTRDEAFYWASKRKERAMHMELRKLREEVRANLEKERKRTIQQRTMDSWR